jgi:hypothetical protein
MNAISRNKQRKKILIKTRQIMSAISLNKYVGHHSSCYFNSSSFCAFSTGYGIKNG